MHDVLSPFVMKPGWDQWGSAVSSIAQASSTFHRTTTRSPRENTGVRASLRDFVDRRTLESALGTASSYLMTSPRYATSVTTPGSVTCAPSMGATRSSYGSTLHEMLSGRIQTVTGWCAANRCFAAATETATPSATSI